MLKKISLIITFVLFSCFFLNATTAATEKELIVALNGGVNATKKFLKRVPTYRVYDDYDRTILHYAVELGKYDIIQFLVSENIELSRKGGIYYGTALQDAIFYEKFRIARFLINSGTDLNVKNIDGETALHIAARNGYTDMIEILLANGASKNIYDANGNTPYALVPKFMKDNSKKLKKRLKPDVEPKIDPTYNMNSATFTQDEMEFGSAKFTLDEMNFDKSDNRGIQEDNSAVSSSKAIDMVDQSTKSLNSDIGIRIESH